jgi:hypothetical protein
MVNCVHDFINKIPGYKGGYKQYIEIKQNYIKGIHNCYEFIKSHN